MRVVGRMLNAGSAAGLMGEWEEAEVVEAESPAAAPVFPSFAAILRAPRNRLPEVVPEAAGVLRRGIGPVDVGEEAVVVI